MYATTQASPASPAVPPPAAFRKTLSAIYVRHTSALRDLARPRVRSSADAWDAVQDAFLFVLEHPPTDRTERGITSALEAAVRNACGHQARQQKDDVNLKIALRKRFPV
jgi:DNA-directed RNA polymerase specialized sigma24 family protein